MGWRNVQVHRGVVEQKRHCALPARAQASNPQQSHRLPRYFGDVKSCQIVKAGIVVTVHKDAMRKAGGINDGPIRSSADQGKRLADDHFLLVGTHHRSVPPGDEHFCSDEAITCMLTFEVCSISRS